ncbi:MAG TPA: AAA family ATPase, partial [Chitinophagaceae bacterium]|nr:AAA family ATPase [Chitinophagaceae bacterium]
NKNSILVIEDAENIVVSRDKNSKSPVSALLNITDGLLSDCLNIQVICSFNTDISKIDGALLRKGRLIAKYEFRELSAAKANALSVKLGFNKEFTQPASLADIYNQSEDFCVQDNQSQPLGFKLS